MEFGKQTCSKPQLPHNLNMQYVANQGGQKRLPNVECVSAVAKTQDKQNKTRGSEGEQEKHVPCLISPWLTDFCGWQQGTVTVPQCHSGNKCSTDCNDEKCRSELELLCPLWLALHLSISVCCLRFALGIFVQRDVPSN